jgi:hypothetical protein
LKRLPKILDETYARMLEAITDDEDQEIAIRALQWLAFSNRPLTIYELAETAVIDPGQDPAVQIDNRFEDPFAMLRILSSLVTVRPRDAEDSEVLLSHFSVKEYLV